MDFCNFSFIKKPLKAFYLRNLDECFSACVSFVFALQYFLSSSVSSLISLFFIFFVQFFIFDIFSLSVIAPSYFYCYFSFSVPFLIFLIESAEERTIFHIVFYVSHVFLYFISRQSCWNRWNNSLFFSLSLFSTRELLMWVVKYITLLFVLSCTL